MAEEIYTGSAREPAMSSTGESPQVMGAESSGASATQAAKEQAKQQAGAMWHDTRENMRSALRQRQQDAAAGVGDVAGALRSAAQELDGRQKGSAARMVERAADGLERLSGTLRSKDLESMVSEAERFARREPALFLGAAVAAGFLAVRFLRSSSEHPTYDESDHDDLATGSPPEGSQLH